MSNKYSVIIILYFRIPSYPQYSIPGQVNALIFQYCSISLCTVTENLSSVHDIFFFINYAVPNVTF